MLGILLAGTVLGQPADPFEAGFQQPPAGARPLIWWHWLSGAVSKEGITADLQAMKDVGLAGTQVFSVLQTLRTPEGRDLKGSVEFLSPEWRTLVAHTANECRRLGLELSILNCEGWGEAGGRTVVPSESMQRLVWTETQVIGGRKVALDLVRPVPAPEFYEDIALVAFPTGEGDESIPPPKMTPSTVVETTTRASAKASAPMFTMPIAWPGKPQSVTLDFGQPRAFSSVCLALNSMRDIADPVEWDKSSFLNAAMQQTLRALPPPHHWELQASDDGETYRAIARISTHGTSSFPETRARFFRIWMPVPPPLQKTLPFSGRETMEFTAIRLGGPRLDRPEFRAGQFVDWSVREFSGQQVPANNVIPRHKVIDLSGRRDWDAPPGNWTLLRLGHASTGSNVGPAINGGLEADKLSRTAMRNFLELGATGTVVSDLGPLVGTTLKNILCDSWESGYENWTPLMREEFQQRRGYPMDPWLPALTGQVVESVDASERFLWDYRRTLADLVAKNYYGELQAYAHEHNMGVYAEATGHGLPTIADQLQCKGWTDVPMGEFWTGRGDLDDTKEAASAAHIFGKPIAGAESFTAPAPLAKWNREPFDYKAEGDLRFCLGINRMSLHRYAHQPWLDRKPGISTSAYGSNFERTNTWWYQGAAWIQYLSRCQFLLQRGQFVADLCYFYGEDAPVDFHFDRLEPKPPAGFDFDACNADVLAEQMRVRDGRIVLPGGMSYRVLVLPRHDRMTPRVLRAVQRLVQDGATVVGPKPMRSPSLGGYPDCDAEVRRIADEVWGNCDGRTTTSHKYGAGMLYWGEPLERVLGDTADFRSSDAKLRYIHRREGETDIYFVSNQGMQATTASCTFRVTERAPELWHPDTGQHERAAEYRFDRQVVTVPLRLEPAGSVFVVFRRPANAQGAVVSVERADGAAPGADVLERADDGALRAWTTQAGTLVATTQAGRRLTASLGTAPVRIPVDGRWTLRFPPNLGAPASVQFDHLMSWTQSSDDGVKYFSGTATYSQTIDMPMGEVSPDTRLWLDLGTVKNLARVKVNGVDFGVLWKPPYTVEVSRAIHAGKNALEIEVTNLWPNRLIGDQKVPVVQRITWTTYTPYQADAPLLPSGLLGPVTLQAARRIEFH
jgi:hypothetical protein